MIDPIDVLKWYDIMNLGEYICSDGICDNSSYARTLADNIHTLEDLKLAIINFKNCEISLTATNVVFADGASNAEIMIIGEAPGAKEDVSGIPFCGDSGKLLDKMLASINLLRDKNIYVTNTVFWRPPNNRRPTSDELAICRPFVEKHISLIKPKLIILVGATAVQALLEEYTPISKIRQKYYSYKNKYMNNEVLATAIFHPAYLLRQPKQKKLAWDDLLQIQNFIQKNNITI